MGEVISIGGDTDKSQEYLVDAINSAIEEAQERLNYDLNYLDIIGALEFIKAQTLSEAIEC